MIQKLDEDQTVLMPPELPAGFFIPDEDYNAGVSGEVPAQGVNPAKGANPEKKRAPEPEPMITQDKMRDVLTKLLDEKVGELFEKLAGDSSGPSIRF